MIPEGIERQMEFIVEQQAQASQIVTQLSLDITALQATVEKNSADITRLSVVAEKNTTDIARLTAVAEKNTTDLTRLISLVANNTRDIAVLQDESHDLHRILYRISGSVEGITGIIDKLITMQGEDSAATRERQAQTDARLDRIAALLEQYVTQGRNGHP